VSRLKIFNYHNVAVAPAGARMKKLYVTPQLFERQCGMLKRLGLRGVTLTEGLAALARGDANNSVALTFDDGYADNLTHAAPILEQFGFRATCYVVAGYVGSHNAWDAELLGVEKPLMSREQLQKWLAAGNEIGSHTLSHPHLHRLSRQAAEEEVVASRIALMRSTGATVDHFCYPFGEYNDETLAIVRSAGYRSAVTTQRGVAERTHDPMRLPRISINGDKGMFKFTLKAATSYAGLKWRRAA
jgi:peptidoglycan/xylan/chitin deacetylase (PgdA/CDA1 family)